MAYQEVRRMARKRRNFSGAFKAKVALAACRGDKTTVQRAGSAFVAAEGTPSVRTLLIRSLLLLRP